MSNFSLMSIGIINADENGFFIKLDKKFIPAIKGLDGFKYIQLLYWLDKCDNETSRTNLVEAKPYKCGPDELGVFATRSPQRPNPIGTCVAYVTYIDEENGIIGLAYIDAFNGTPVLDIKPYTPSIDRVEEPIVPDWCSNWPKNVETSGDFDWESVFNF